MSNKLIFRVLGALASSLIIASVFIPFVDTSNYTQSLWEAYSISKELYLPIIIIVFGVIGILFFSINIKTEFAYSTAGALTFYLITETVSFINQSTFDMLGVGYYCLLTGTILTACMAFICNLKSNKSIKIESIKTENELSVLDQIDKLYLNPNTIEPTQNINMVNHIDSSIIPPIQPISNQQLEVNSLENQVENTNSIMTVEVNQNPIEQHITSNIEQNEYNNTSIVESNENNGNSVLGEVTMPHSQEVAQKMDQIEYINTPVTKSNLNSQEQYIKSEVVPGILNEELTPSSNLISSTQSSTVEISPNIKSEEVVSMSNNNQPPQATTQQTLTNVRNSVSTVDNQSSKSEFINTISKNENTTPQVAQPFILNTSQQNPIQQSTSQSILSQSNPVVQSFNIGLENKNDVVMQNDNSMFIGINNSSSNNSQPTPENSSSNLDIFN